MGRRDAAATAERQPRPAAASAALDRVLLFNYYVVPSYALRNERIARWDRFGHPDKLPEFAVGFPQVWWYDEAKAAKTGVAQ